MSVFKFLNNRIILLLFFLLGEISNIPCTAQKILTLSNEQILISWVNVNDKWLINKFEAKTKCGFQEFGKPWGEYRILYSHQKPLANPIAIMEQEDTLKFPEETFKCVIPTYKQATTSVPMNKAGKYLKFYPTTGCKKGDSIVFEKYTEYGRYEATWTIDKEYPSDILLNISLMVEKDGYYSLPTPSLSTIQEEELEWGVVPGFFQGNKINASFPLSYVYAQGLPKYPVLCRESTITTMASIITNRIGVTMAVIPMPGQDRNPYHKDKSTHFAEWKIALSHMDNESRLTPVAYHPILGETGSFLKKGDVIDFKVRIALQETDWYSMYKHAVYDIYNLKYSFQLKENKMSLSNRLIKLMDYVLDDKTALWNEEEYKGHKIMAQSYMTDVVGADGDAMKNSDIGAVWMLARITQDEVFNKRRIPYIKNFKILQQAKNGFFKGAVEGQYYLSKTKHFTEEWGHHFEPVSVTYYTMADLGNILLFDSTNTELKNLLKNGAERLLKWQQEDGSWVIAYDRDTHLPIYTDLKDFRPTFYGLLIAYKLLGDTKYLKSAEKGADWIIEHAVKNGYFVGVCGDVRFVNDFSTIQIACAMLDLYEITQKQKYLDAAIQTAKMYVTSIYTQPIPSRKPKLLKDKMLQDWQLSQVGLGFEHGGSMGSAVHAGPILLASHSGFFLKMYDITKDSLFLDLSRLGVHGRDAFVNQETGVASYYWVKFDNGAGPYPHHAWWQIGWIYDYLLSEAELRANGRIAFPRGFMTPKVGPHKTVGLAPGSIDGEKVSLLLKKGLVEIDNPNIDYITAESLDKKTLYVVFLNNQSVNNKFTYKINLPYIYTPKREGYVSLDGWGHKIVKIPLTGCS